MVAVQTAEKEIDRKLYEIFKATRQSLKTVEELAAAVQAKMPRAFIVVREGREEVAGERTIEGYIRFAVEISLLDSRVQPTLKKSQVRSLKGFQIWLTNQAQIYLETNRCSGTDIGRVVRELVSGLVATLPSDKNVHQALMAPIDLPFFRHATRLMSIFQTGDYSIRSGPVFLVKGIIEDVLKK